MRLAQACAHLARAGLQHMNSKKPGKHTAWLTRGRISLDKGSHFQPSKSFLAASLLVGGLARGVSGGIHPKT